MTQSQLAKEFGIEGKNFFYILKNLECRGLIVKQPAVVRKKEPCTEGESKNSSPVTTNLIYLYRYAKLLSSQQRFEIYKEEQAVESLGYDDENVPDDDGFALENVKEIVRVNDYLPAMKAVCDKLEEANGKVNYIQNVVRFMDLMMSLYCFFFYFRFLLSQILNKTWVIRDPQATKLGEM